MGYDVLVDTILNINLFYIIETIGIYAFALSGMILAKKKQFDLVGCYIIACITAFGGGTIRDVILDIQPVYWITHWEYPSALLITVFILSLFKHVIIKDSWLFIPDAMGLSFITVTSAQLAHNTGLPIIVIGILTTIVACFGGVLRDVLCQEVPIIFKKNTPIYASLAFLGAIAYVLLIDYANLPVSFTMISCSLSVFLLRVIVKKLNIVLPL